MSIPALAEFRNPFWVTPGLTRFAFACEVETNLSINDANQIHMFYSTRPLFDNSAAATAAESAAREARSEVELLKNDVDRLLLISEALWTLLKREHGYNDEVLTQLIQEIDMRDGRLDGRTAASAPSECPSCKRVNSPRRSVCLYCGAALTSNPFAR